MHKARIAIVGATGNIGREIVRMMEEKKGFVSAPVLLGSSVSEGDTLPYFDDDLEVKSVKDYDFKDIDVAIFATAKQVSEVYVPKAKDAGVKVVDLSSYLRADASTTLYFDDVTQDVSERTDVLALPTIPSLQLAKVLKVVENQGLQLEHATTTAMCAVSMAGRDAMDELFAQSASLLGGAGAEDAMPENFKTQMAYNVIPQVGEFSGPHTEMETAMIMEVNRALTSPVPLTATAVYVPSFVGVAQSVTLEIAGGLDVDTLRKALDEAEGVRVIDNPEKQEYSTPFGAAETDMIYVSRLREDMLAQGKLQFWLTGDNMRLAAISALNAAAKIA